VRYAWLKQKEGEDNQTGGWIALAEFFRLPNQKCSRSAASADA